MQDQKGPSRKRWREAKIELDTLDLVVLMFNVFKAEKDPQVGFEDANNTLEMLIKQLNFRFKTSPEAIESALWSCNLLDEKKEFWHPFGMSFDAFVKKALPRYTLNKVYNTIERKY